MPTFYKHSVQQTVSTKLMALLHSGLVFLLLRIHIIGIHKNSCICKILLSLVLNLTASSTSPVIFTAAYPYLSPSAKDS